LRWFVRVAVTAPNAPKNVLDEEQDLCYLWEHDSLKRDYDRTETIQRQLRFDRRFERQRFERRGRA
jgi:hypothetical protein